MSAEARDTDIEKIETLLQKLEEAMKTPWHATIFGLMTVKEEVFYEILSNMRQSLPAVIEDAKEIIRRKEQILENAREEHKRILDTAEERMKEIVSEHEIVRNAHLEGERIADEARRETVTLRRETAGYVAGMLRELEEKFEDSLSTIRTAIGYLEKKQESL